MMTSTILIADKPSYRLEDYKNFLTRKGHKVFLASSFEEMATLYESTTFGLLFLGSALVDDLDSPFLRAIKKDHRDCKFVLITNDLNAEIFLNALHCCVFHECLLGPLDLTLLEKVVDDLTQPKKEILFGPLIATGK